MQRLWIVSMMSAAALALAACGGTTTPESAPPAATQSAPGEDAAQAVEMYLTAKVAGDRDAMAQVLCSSLESRLDAEALSFNAVEASIEGMRCSTDADGSSVTCEGRIVAVYGAENRDFPLGRYSVVEEDGAWKWCGEAAP